MQLGEGDGEGEGELKHSPSGQAVISVLWALTVGVNWRDINVKKSKTGKSRSKKYFNSFITSSV